MENSEKFIILSDDFALNFPTKSFHCTFCKRGFSNAQALGGHMNIHRKDRAKLREFSDENLLSLEILKNTNWEDSHPPNSSPREKLSWENDRSSDSDPAESLNYIRGKPPRRLPLFAEVPPRLSGGEVSGGVLGKHADSREERLKYGELDLELRLGPEPNDNQGSSEFKVNVLQGTRARELKKG